MKLNGDHVRHNNLLFDIHFLGLAASDIDAVAIYQYALWSPFSLQSSETPKAEATYYTQTKVLRTRTVM
jgi:hypothetical protein